MISPRRFRPQIEPLEARTLMDASAILTRVEAIAVPRSAVSISLPLTADRIEAPTSGRTLYQITVAPNEGSELNLGSFRVLDGRNRTMAARFSRSGDTLVGLFQLPHADFRVSVRGQGASLGEFRMEVRLVGDVDGDRTVDQADLEAIGAAIPGQGGSQVAALLEGDDFDLNNDGRVGFADLALAQRNLNATATTITFNLVNNTGLFDSTQMYITGFGQDQSGSWFYFNPSGNRVATTGLQTVPAFSFNQIPNGLEVSNQTFIHGRFMFGAGSPAVAPVVNQQGAVAAANPGNPTDPNNSIYNDFLEYTILTASQNGGVPNLNIDTSQVDQLGIPMQLQTSPVDPNSPNGVGIIPTRTALVAAFQAYVEGTPFEVCLTTPGTGAHGVYRILSPQDVLQLNPNVALKTYFDAAIDAFFQQYENQTLTLTFENNNYVGQTKQIQNEGHTYTVMQFTGAGGTFNVYYPFFTTNTPGGYTPHYATAPPPSWIISAGKQNESPSQMVFANDGVFADNAGQFPGGGQPSQILGNLENQIVSALSRGIALQPPGTWQNTATFYPVGGVWNRYAAFWHQPTINIDGKAYGFPFDDQGGHSSDLSVNNPQTATITFGAWA